MYVPIWIIIIGVVIYFFWFRKNKKENHIEEKTNKFVGRHQQACAVKKILGQNIPQMEIQIASNKDFHERKKLDESLKELEQYVSSNLFGSMEQFAKTDMQVSLDSITKIVEAGYDTCVLQNDRKMEERVLKIFVDLSEYIDKVISENSGKEFKTTEDMLNSSVVIGTMKFISLGGLLKADEEKNAWIIMDSLDNPERIFGYFNKSNLIKISLTTIKNNSAKKVAIELEKTVNDLLNKERITGREADIAKKLIEQGIAENFKTQGVPNIDDLYNDQKDILKHLADYRKKTGKQMPTYEEMLKMEKDEMRTWALYRVQKENREKLLEEMIAHEEKTGSLRKTVRKEITEGEQAVLNVFDREKSSGTVNALNKIGEILLEDDKEEKDFVMDAIFAKIASDSVGLGEKMENERNSK